MGRYEYLCNSEDRPHYNEDYYYNYSPQPARGLEYFTPPTFVTYNLQINEEKLMELYREEIAKVVKQKIQDASQEQIQLVTNQVLNNIDLRVSTTIDQ